MKLEQFDSTIITGTFLSSMDAQGNPIPHPPIHQHHVHLIPQNPAAAVSLLATPLRVVEKHGDWQFERHDD